MSSLLHIPPAVKPAIERSWSAYFVALFPDASYQLQWQTDVAGYLFERRYHVSVSAEVLAHAAEHGTVECCSALKFDDRDRAAVEAKLPVAPPSSWALHDNDTWTLGPEA